jgi:hypothetical protein
MSSKPIWKNTAALTTLAIIAALGIVVRFFIQIPVIPGVVVLTPGFVFSLLGGIVGGIPGGALVGAIVGLSGALSGTEIPLLPMIGNVFLGIGSGYAIHFSKRDTPRYALLVILGGGVIGGFIPTMTIFASFVDPLVVNLSAALVDMFQAMLWAAVALGLERGLIRPIAGKQLYGERRNLELDLQEVSDS